MSPESAGAQGPVHGRWGPAPGPPQAWEEPLADGGATGSEDGAAVSRVRGLDALRRLQAPLAAQTRSRKAKALSGTNHLGRGAQSMRRDAKFAGHVTWMNRAAPPGGFYCVRGSVRGGEPSLPELGLKIEMSIPVAEYGWDFSPRHGQVGAHDESFDRWCAQAQEDWARHFPVRHGYVLLTLPLPDGARGCRLSALRGDFRADLDLRWSPDLWSRDRSAGSLCVRAQASSQRLAEAEDRAVAWSSVFSRTRWWLAPAMFLIGASCILASATLGHLVLAGVLSFMVASFLAYAGVWGDHVQGFVRARAWAAMLAEGSMQGDLRRWRAVGQVMDRRRKDLHRRSLDTPFRRGARPELAYKCA